MFEGLRKKYEDFEATYKKIEEELSKPDVYSNPKRAAQLSQQRAQLEEKVRAWQEYKKMEAELEQAKAMLDDEEFRALAKEEIESLQEGLQNMEKKLFDLAVPQDPMDSKNIYLEIRAGTGGEEAALFAGELLRMYTRYAERKGWNVEMVSISPTELGGVKEVVIKVSGHRVYSFLKHESGVHRVQRVPKTEAGGRIHTSAVTVAVLPEADDIDIEIKEEDLEIDVFRASGAGGQHVNRTDSAVRITHKPTGIVVTCQDERSQHQNKAKALSVLKARLFEMERQRQAEETASNRRAQVGSGDRSEKIRTYNFPQNRVTDHRIGLTLYKLEQIMDGDLDEIMKALAAWSHEEAVKRLKSEI